MLIFGRIFRAWFYYKRTEKYSSTVPTNTTRNMVHGKPFPVARAVRSAYYLGMISLRIAAAIIAAGGMSWAAPNPLECLEN